MIEQTFEFELPELPRGYRWNVHPGKNRPDVLLIEIQKRSWKLFIPTWSAVTSGKVTGVDIANQGGSVQMAVDLKIGWIRKNLEIMLSESAA